MSGVIEPKIHPSWRNALSAEFQKDYFFDLKQTLQEEKSSFTVFPESKNIFNAFDSTPFNEVKVVIIGQDPYHNPGQAHGLSFSVPEGIKAPPSLQNIYKELSSDIGIKNTTGNLTSWAQQGVLLLNAALTVRAHEASSHSNIGWHQFTDAAIKILSNRKENLVFILWGGFAKKKSWLIDSSKHLILKAAHPSPLSAHKGFFGCQHFSQTNQYLVENGKEPIDWSIT